MSEVIDPKAQEVIDAQIKAEASKSPAEAATLLFNLYYPRFCAAIDELPAKSLKRLIKAWMGVPLVDAQPNLKRPQERVAFSIGENLLEAKMIVTLNTLYAHQSELQRLETSEPAILPNPT